MTGDRSALHVSEAFARRSAYRRPVVHGMLPVGFIALIDRFPPQGPSLHSGRNLRAFFRPGLRWRPARPFRRPARQARKDAIDFNYVVRHEASGSDCDPGIVDGRISARTAREEIHRDGREQCSPTARDAERASRRSTGARPTPSSSESRARPYEYRRSSGRSRWGAGGLRREPGRTSSTCQPAVDSLFSTSVGICLPGPPRRFWSSRPRVTEKPNPTPCTDCRRRAHRSLSTRIGKKSLTISKSIRGGGPALFFAARHPRSRTHRPGGCRPCRNSRPRRRTRIEGQGGPDYRC